MRALFTVFSGGSHLYLMVPLAWACRAAGHEVRLVSTPQYADELVRTGLPGVTVGGGPIDYPPEGTQRLVSALVSADRWPLGWVVNPHLLSADQRALLEEQGRYGIALAETMVDDLIGFGRAWRPDVIVYDAVTYAGAVAAAALGVPGVRHLYGVCSAARVELRTADGEALPEYHRLFERFGVDARTQPTFNVDITPPSMRLAVTPPCLDVRFVAHNGPGVEPTGLDGRRDRPRVCVTWGLSTAVRGRSDVEPLRALIQAIAMAGVEVVVAATAPQIASMGALPAGVMAIASVPLQLILPYCDVLVQQGGEGTTLTAAALGVKQLIISRKADSVLTAGGLAGTGAGIHLRHQDLPSLEDGPAGAVAVRAALCELLGDPAYQNAADRLRDEIERQPAPAELVAALVAAPSHRFTRSGG
jgi:UDP:flavonoid glycosyltransferase YjiC (YdhE family)